MDEEERRTETSEEVWIRCIRTCTQTIQIKVREQSYENDLRGI